MEGEKEREGRRKGGRDSRVKLRQVCETLFWQFYYNVTSSQNRGTTNLRSFWEVISMSHKTHKTNAFSHSSLCNNGIPMVALPGGHHRFITTNVYETKL